ncbi:hypothetical protein ACIODS_12195 [Micromonospora chalcea]|uniref:hypothetical protein n=1 Tax=Micromonospora chalcea TaxID=1874 RepID=UPI003819CF3A
MASRTNYGSGGVINDPSRPADRGYLTWTHPPYANTGVNLIPNAGILYLRRIRRVPPAAVTSILAYVGGGGSALTAGQCGAALYTAAGTLIGQTADQASSWQSGGLKTMPLVGGPYQVTAGDYYVAVWWNGTTSPQLARAGTGLFTALPNAGLAAPAFDAATANGSVTTTAPATLGAQTIAAIEFWFALA